jgi:hypothetical protein
MAVSITELHLARRGLTDLEPWLSSPSAAPHLDTVVVVDASRNSVRTCAGLDRLRSVRHVNLYYNKIDSLASLLPLRACPQLRVLDLRLNPLCRGGGDDFRR